MTEEIEAKPNIAEEEKEVKEEEEEEEKPLVINSEEDSMEDEDEDDEPAAEIIKMRESHAPQVDVNQLHKEPDFAVVCSFFNKFGAMIGMKPLSFTKLESLLTSFDADGHVNKELMDIHLMLMRRIRMLSVRAENWENYLKKFLGMNETTEEQRLQVERYGYVNLPVTSKIQILKALCDAQFDYNPKMKENMSTACRANNLRLIPLGMDKNGLIYWYQQDCEYNIRIYTEEPDDQSGVTWSLIVRDQDELNILIDRLKSEDLGYVKKETDAKEKEKEAALTTDPQAQMLMSTKKGTFLDLYLDEATIKRMREFLIKQKEERKNKRDGKKEKEEEKEENEVEEEEEPQEEDLDRRLMPRRSAASKATSNIRKLVTPKAHRTSRKVKKSEGGEEEGEEEENNSAQEDKDSVKKEGSETATDEDEEADDEEDDFTEEETEEDDDDDEFKPKSEKPKKKRRKRGPRKKKHVVDDDEEDDTDEEEIQKERKVATGDSACGQCKQSCDWDVLLLCDVCDDAWHTYCLKPMLWFVPDGDWFCPKCVHGMLIEKMEEVAKVLDENLKKKYSEDRKKKAAADRLRREMEYIGVSLNNIIPTTFKQTAIPSSSSSSDEDTTQRKSKRKAVKKIAPRSRFQMEVMATIAEGRSRRRTQRVDYNFKDYDEAIHDACVELGEERPPSRHGEVVRPSGGVGSKDMANIYEAERRASIDENGQPIERLSSGKPVKTKTPKSRKKLNDLDLDNMEESESDEYQANESEEEAADEEDAMSGSEYVPSEEERRRTRRGGYGRRGFDGPTASDEDFVVSDSDGSYGYRSGKGQKKKEGKKKKKMAKYASDDETEEEEEDDESYYSDDSRDAKKSEKKGGKVSKTTSSNRRWTAKEDSDDEEDEEEQEDEEELEGEETDEDAPRTQSGRPLRRAVVEKPQRNTGSDVEEEEEEVEEPPKMEERPVGALDRVKKKGSDSETEFKPDEEEEEEDEDEDEEEEIEMPKKPTKKRKISDSDEDSDEEEEIDDSKRLAPQPPKMMKTTTPPKKPVVAPTVPEKPIEIKPIIQKTNGATEIPTQPITVNKQEPVVYPAATPSPRAVFAEAKSLSVTTPIGGPPSKPTPPMNAPQPSYGPLPGGYQYYQGAPPPMMPPHPGYMPPAQYPNPYGAPPPPGYMGGNPYAQPPGAASVHNPYAPIHNPYAHQGAASAPTSTANNYNDLQSL